MEQRANAHVVIISYPLQGHFGPLVKLSHLLASHGVKVTFISTEHIHKKVASSMAEFRGEKNSLLRLVGMPDGLEDGDDRNDKGKLFMSISRMMPGLCAELLRSQLEKGDKIACVVAVTPVCWALDLAEKMGIKGAIFWCAAAGALASLISIPKLIEAGIINDEGLELKNEKVELLPNLPAMDSSEFLWSFPDDPTMQKNTFQFLCSVRRMLIMKAPWIITNWFNELHPSASGLLPKIIPVGPLLTGNHDKFCGTFWSEDLTCLDWLDKQPEKSVIYIAFGSLAKLSKQQFHEIAHGLVLSGRPFLWVVRADLLNDQVLIYPDGFLERSFMFGKIVNWAPQEEVLAHPSTGCFVSHCGWNSVMEGMSVGVPFLCWPCFADQLYAQTCICDAWKIGLKFEKDKDGLIVRQEIKTKITELFSSDSIKENALKLRNMARESVSEGGTSSRFIKSFIEQIKS